MRKLVLLTVGPLAVILAMFGVSRLASPSVLARSSALVRLLSKRAQSHGVRTPFGNKLPLTVHRTLTLDDLHPGRLIIIGDVHGCNTELHELLKGLKFKKGHDNLIFVGDLVNKGPYSVEVVRTFRDLGAVGVRGNHCDSVLSTWNQWAKDGVAPKQDWVKRMEPEDVAVLDGLPFTLSVPELGFTVVHAGLVPTGPHQQQDLPALLPQQQFQDMLCMRNLIPVDEPGSSNIGASACQSLKPTPAHTPSGHELHQPSSSDHELAHPSPEPEAQHWAASKQGLGGAGVAWAPEWPGPVHVFFGHDAKRGLQMATFATGLDTGCAYGKCLTAAVLPPPQQLLKQSAAVRAHAAAWQEQHQGQEEGRNEGVNGSIEVRGHKAGGYSASSSASPKQPQPQQQQHHEQQQDGVAQTARSALQGGGSSGVSRMSGSGGLPGITRDDLHCEIHQVSAHKQYVVPDE